MNDQSVIQRRGCVAALVIMLTMTAILVFVANFYTAERRWVAGVRLGASLDLHPLLKIALTQCVAAHDPAELGNFERTGFYKTSGWFLDERREGAVARCMSDKNWLLLPVHLYTL